MSTTSRGMILPACKPPFRQLSLRNIIWQHSSPPVNPMHALKRKALQRHLQGVLLGIDKLILAIAS